MSHEQKQKQHMSELAKCLFQLRQEKSLCDATLIAKDGRQMKAHSAVLAATSSVFCTALDKIPKRSERIFRLPWLDFHVLEIAVHFMYSGYVVVSPKYAMPDSLPHIIDSLKELGLKLPTYSSCGESDTSVQAQQGAVIVRVKSSSSVLGTGSEKLPETSPSQQLMEFKREELKGEQNHDECDVDFIMTTSLLKSKNKTKLKKVKSEVDQPLTNIDFIDSNDRLTTDSDGFESSHSNDIEQSEGVCGGAQIKTADRNSIVRAQCYSQSTQGAGDRSKKPCLCHLCGKEFAGRRYLINHARIHSGERPYSCADCGREFAHKINLQRHQKVHTGEKPYVCDLCGTGFIQSVQLVDHKSRHHLESVDMNNLPFLCRICGERFLTTHRLRSHKASFHRKLPRAVKRSFISANYHGNVYTCTHCGERFDSSTSLALHKRRHTVKKPFECTVCSCAFETSGELNNHMHRHMSNWPRKVKPVNSADVDGLSSSLHMDSVEFVRQLDTAAYECPFCKKQSMQLSHLKSHMLTHTDERPHKCDMCDKAYRSKFDLRLHYARIHQMDLPSRRSSGIVEVRPSDTNELTVYYDS